MKEAVVRELVRKAEFEAAESLVRARLAEAPDDARAWRYLAGVLDGRKDKAGCAEAAGRAIELSGDDAAGYRNRAAAKALIGDKHGAHADALRAVELDPDDADGLAMLAGSTFFTAGDAGRFQKLAGQAVRRDPGGWLPRQYHRILWIARLELAAWTAFVIALALVTTWALLAEYDGLPLWVPGTAGAAATGLVALVVVAVRLRRPLPPMRGMLIAAVLSTGPVAAATAAACAVTAAATYGTTRNAYWAVLIGGMAVALVVLPAAIVKGKARRLVRA
jgi:tetratricopeptide (TPR) repeat protein